MKESIRIRIRTYWYFKELARFTLYITFSDISVLILSIFMQDINKLISFN